jgi:hypothetical protein
MPLENETFFFETKYAKTGKLRETTEILMKEITVWCDEEPKTE